MGSGLGSGDVLGLTSMAVHIRCSGHTGTYQLWGWEMSS